MKIHKHRKHIKTINTVIESCLIVILIVLVAIMMVLIGKLQGTARVINYTGLVRGATQREVKLEITGNPNDESLYSITCLFSPLSPVCPVLKTIPPCGIPE